MPYNKTTHDISKQLGWKLSDKVATSSTQNKEFVDTLAQDEKDYLSVHVLRYDGVEGVSADEQFSQLVMYVLNFLDGEAPIEKRVYAKAMKMFE
jgi:hypothetical protein